LGSTATHSVGFRVKCSQGEGAFIENFIYRHGELPGGIRPAVAPLHESFALKEHFFGFRLDLENLGYGEADNE
jgi:hypothetical protein